MKEIRMKYEAIHAFPDVINYNQHEFETEYFKCRSSRYQIDQVMRKVPCKVLHYIPIISCLQRLFWCKNIAQFMDCHSRNISQDDIIRMSAYGSAFRYMEEKWPHFEEEPHSVMLSLAIDGVNPFAKMRFVYTVWPIFVINNSIPPWLSIKREHKMLSMIIPVILCLQLFLM